MSRKFIAAVLATSIALTGFAAAPSRAASDEDIAKFLFGATALFIVGAALSNRNTPGDVKVTPNHPAPLPLPPKYAAPKPAPKFNRTLPRFCKSRIWTEHGNQNFMDGRCLRQNYAHAKHLPRNCRGSYGRNENNRRRGYDIRCLKTNGFKIARP